MVLQESKNAAAVDFIDRRGILAFLFLVFAWFKQCLRAFTGRAC